MFSDKHKVQVALENMRVEQIQLNFGRNWEWFALIPDFSSRSVFPVGRQYVPLDVFSLINADPRRRLNNTKVENANDRTRLSGKFKHSSKFVTEKIVALLIL